MLSLDIRTRSLLFSAHSATPDLAGNSRHDDPCAAQTPYNALGFADDSGRGSTVDTSPLRVLAVEDCREDQAKLLQMAKGASISLELKCVSSIEEARRFLDRHQVDAILLDLELPGTSGIATFHSFRSLVPELPVLVLSETEDANLEVEAVQEGAQDCLVKSELTPSILVRSIRYSVERQQLLARLKESEERYVLAAAGANDGLWDWRLDRKEIYFSPRWKSMLGYAEQEIGSTPDEWFQRIHADDVRAVREELDLHLKGLVTHFEYEYRMRHKDGGYRWMLGRGVAVRNSKGKATRIVGSQTDVTRRKLAEAKLMFEAHHDGLTLLPNRTQLVRRLNRMLEQGKRRSDDRQFAVLYVDFDRFKLINDSLGHAAGDELLIVLTRRLKECVRPQDMVARLGGDEFAILLEEVNDVADALRVASRIHKSMEEPVLLQGHEMVTSASVGIAIRHPNYDDADDVLRDADVAMYRAKNQGRGRSVVFDSTMHEQAIARLRIEEELRTAITKGQLRLCYQPIVCLKTQKIVGFEALIRWEHPERGLIAPADFLPMAEETGLIHPLGVWAMEQACKQALAWKHQFSDNPLAMNVNLSACQIGKGRFVEEVRDILRNMNVQPHQLVLRVEITESALMEQAGAVPEAISELKALGIQLCIDDFGVGYSSLSYLHRLPVDMLKIDRSFISRLDVSGENTEIVRTIIVLAHSVGLQVVAEGVERYEHVVALRSMHCEYGQGYLYSRPVPGDAATQLLEFEKTTQQSVANFPGRI